MPFFLLLHALATWLTPAPRRDFPYNTTATSQAIFNHDGRLVLVGNQKTIGVFHGRTALLIREQTAHSQPITALATWTDRDTVISSDASGTILAWQADNLALVARYQAPGPVRILQTRPHHPEVAIVGAKAVWLVNPFTGQKQTLSPAATVSALAFDETGTQLAIGYKNGGLQIRNLVTRQSRWLPQSTQAIQGVVLRHDSLLVSIGTEAFRIWDLRSGHVSQSLAMPRNVMSLASANNQTVLGLDNGDLISVDLATQQQRTVGHDTHVSKTLQIHPKEMLLLSSFDAGSPKTWLLMPR